MLPSLRCMSAAGSAAASALLPERWTQMWRGELSEQECRPAHALPLLPADDLQPEQLHEIEEGIEEVL